MLPQKAAKGRGEHIMIEIEDARDLAKRDSGTLRKPIRPLSVGQLELALLERYPRKDAEEWDRTGLLVGDPAALVEGVAVALDPTPSAVREAKRVGANVLLTHHPAFIDAPGAFSPSHDVASTSGASVYEAAACGVALMDFHTALDASVEATRLFPRLMSLDFERLLVPLAHDRDKGYGMLCSVRDADAPFKLSHLAARATSVFGRIPRVWGDLGATLRTVVIANGSASGVVDACLAAKADCLLCGEIRYHAALDAAQAGLAIAELGHDVSELPLCALLAQAAVRAGVPEDAVMAIDQSANWRYPEPTRI